MIRFPAIVIWHSPPKIVKIAVIMIVLRLTRVPGGIGIVVTPISMVGTTTVDTVRLLPVFSGTSGKDFSTLLREPR